MLFSYHFGILQLATISDFESVAFSTSLVFLTFGACSVIHLLYQFNIIMVCKSERI